MTAGLTDLVDAGVVNAATLRLARHLGFLYDEDDEWVIMATACAIAALSAGSVCFEVDQVAGLNTELQWPATSEWLDVLSSSPMVSTEASRRDRPLILDGNSVYLTRYWAEQEKIADWVLERIARQDPAPAQSALDQFCDPAAPQQRAAAELAARSGFSVVAGGPGTGKTTVVAQILAVLAAGRVDALRVILTAPTGRAAARLEQAVRENLARCLGGAPLKIRCASGTLHRILGVKPWGATDHDSTRPLVADVVVVDEASMLSLHMMALLLAAVAEPTRLILLGDPDQLASVEAGAVLADIVTNATAVPVARLSQKYRFCGAIAELSEAIRRGDGDTALEILERGGDQIEWVASDPQSGGAETEELEPLRSDLTRQGLAMIRAGQGGDVDEAIRWLNSHRLLLAHRYGPTGISHWTQLIRGWISHQGAGSARALWYPGLPVLVTRNDDMLNIFNGDSGVVVARGGTLSLAFDDGAGARLIPPDMIESWEPLYACTIHKAQGSQFDRVSVILPPPGTALATRELFYTAVTRSKSFLRIVGSAESIRQAIASPALRASGLASRLAR